MDIQIKKLAWHRDASVPAGVPAPGVFDCPRAARSIGAVPYGGEQQHRCECGAVIDGTGWLLRGACFEHEPREPEPTEPGEEDATLTPAGPLGARTAATFGHEHLGCFREQADAEAAIAAAMAAARFWPDVWQISDHGNAHLISERFYAEHGTAAGQ